jgi:multicomponent Na+:H+ antiporter subunit D
MVVVLIIVPLAAALLAPLLGLASKRMAGIMPILATTFNLVFSVLLLPSVVEKPEVISIGGFLPAFSINLVAGPLGVGFSALIALVGLAVALYAPGYIKEGALEKYHTLYLLLLTGATGVVLTGDIFNLFVFYEILCISSYALVAYLGDKNGVEAATKYLIQGSVGSGLILIGIAILYGLFGTLNMAQIAGSIETINSPALLAALILLVTGFGVEAAIFPLNAWLPDAHSSAPSSISAILSGIAIKVGIYAVARLVFTVLGASWMFQILLSLGLLTLLVGEMSAFKQENIKRMLAYSSVGQVGLIVFAIGIGTSEGITAGLFQIVSHALAKGVLFLAVGYMIFRTGSMTISSLNGMGRRMPLVSLACVIAAFSLVGMPPFTGFPSKFLVIRAALAQNNALFTAMVGVVLTGTVIEGAYFFRVVQSLYFRKSDNNQTLEKTPVLTAIPILLLLSIIVVLGIWPDSIIPTLQSAGSELLDKIGYIREVLG